MTQLSLVPYLQEKIAAYVSAKRFHSLMTLSTKSGVPYNTVRRLANGQVDKPTLETVLAILNVVESRANLVKTVERFFPGIGNLIASVHTATGSTAITDAMVDMMSEDQVSFRIYSLAGTRVGTTREDVRQLFGEDGLNKLAALVEQGMVVDNCKGVLHTPDLEYSTVNPHAMLRKMRHCLDFFDKSLIGTDAAALAIQTEAVNVEGLKALRQAARDFHVRLSEIKKDPRYQGDIPFYAILCIGLLDSRNFRPE